MRWCFFLFMCPRLFIPFTVRSFVAIFLCTYVVAKPFDQPLGVLYCPLRWILESQFETRFIDLISCTSQLYYVPTIVQSFPIIKTSIPFQSKYQTFNRYPPLPKPTPKFLNAQRLGSGPNYILNQFQFYKSNPVVIS